MPSSGARLVESVVEKSDASHVSSLTGGWIPVVYASVPLVPAATPALCGNSNRLRNAPEPHDWQPGSCTPLPPPAALIVTRVIDARAARASTQPHENQRCYNPHVSLPPMCG
jgi:hypothetical protein